MKFAFITNLFVAIFVFILFTFNVGIKSFVSTLYLQVITPSISGGQALYNHYSNFVLALDRSAKLDQALQQIKDLSEKLADLEEIKEENNLLKKTLQIKDLEFQDLQLVLGNVIFLDKINDQAVVLVSDKVANKISAGSAVIVADSIIGVVNKVEKSVVFVDLITNKNFIAEAIDVNTKATGLVKGVGGNNVFSDVLNSEKLNLDDIVVVNSTDEKFHNRYVLGKITEVSSAEGEPFQTAKISSFVNLPKLSKVLIVISR